MKTVLFLLLIACALSCNSTLLISQSRLRPPLEEIVNEMAELKNFSFSLYNQFWVGDYEIEEEVLLEKIKKIATTKELVELTKHESKTVKVLSAMALADRNYPNLSHIFNQFLSKNQRIETRRQLYGGGDQLAGVLYRHIGIQIVKTKQLTFYNDLKEQLDSTLLTAEFLLKTNDFDGDNEGFDEKRIDLLESLLCTISPQEKYYAPIRKLCKKDCRPAFIALAKFQKEEDIELILKSNNIFAFSYFPHPKFWKYLNKNKEQTYYWMTAVAAYQNQAASKLIQSMFDDVDFNKEAVNYAIVKHYCSFYDDLVIELWENYQTINFEIIQKMLEKDAEKAAQIFVNGFKGTSNYEFFDNYYELGYSVLLRDTMLTLMLEPIAQYQQETLLEICPIILSKGYCPLNILKKYQVHTTTDILMNDLGKLAKARTKNGRAQLAKMDVLLSFKNKTTTKRVVNYLQTNYPNWIPGIDWRKKVNEMFESHDLPIPDF